MIQWFLDQHILITFSIPLEHRKLIFKDNTLQKWQKKSLIKKKKKASFTLAPFPRQTWESLQSSFLSTSNFLSFKTKLRTYDKDYVFCSLKYDYLLFKNKELFESRKSYSYRGFQTQKPTKPTYTHQYFDISRNTGSRKFWDV